MEFDTDRTLSLDF